MRQVDPSGVKDHQAPLDLAGQHLSQLGVQRKPLSGSVFAARLETGPLHGRLRDGRIAKVGGRLTDAQRFGSGGWIRRAHSESGGRHGRRHHPPRQGRVGGQADDASLETPLPPVWRRGQADGCL